MNERDVVVIGGGLSGLAAAALAARRGLTVTVVERHQEVGGRASTDVRQGFSLNRGAHALYNGGAARRVLNALSILPRGGVPSPNGGFAFDRGAMHALPGGPISLLTSGLLSLSAKLEVARWLARLKKRPAPAGTAEDLACEVSDPAARALLRMLIRTATYSIDFSSFSGALALEQVRRATYDQVVYLDHGWRTLVDALRARAEAFGATILEGDGAAGIELQDGIARAVVTTSGARIAARSVILAASPSVARALCDVPSLRRAESDAVPVRAACVDLALSSLPRPSTRLVLGIDRPLYLSVHSAWAELAPKGGAVVHLVRYLAEDERAEEAHIDELEALMERAQPGYRARLLERRVLPAMVVSNARVGAGGVAARPDVRVPELANVLLAGDWVGPEGFLADAALASAERAAAALQLPSHLPARAGAIWA